MNTKLHMYHIFYMKCTVLLVFSCVFYCVFTAETCTCGTFYMYTKIHMYHILYMKCTVLLVFSCVFTGFSLQKHEVYVHFTCLPKNTCNIYYTWNAQFASVFMCFHSRNIYFWYISHVYQNTHVLYIIHMKCTVFLCFHVFLLFFYSRNMYFWFILRVYQNTHVPYIKHEMHSFASVFMGFHRLFTAETFTFGTFHMYTKIHMYHILYIKNA
jgi:hypothetical protein